MQNNQSKLARCPDCNHSVSTRAESCPSCGRFFQSIRLTEVIGRDWMMRIAGGIILGYFGIIIVNVILFALFGSIIVGALVGGLDRPTKPPTNSNRQF